MNKLKTYLTQPLTKVNKWLLFFNLCCIVATAVAMLAPYVSAQVWAMPAMANIVFPYLYITNIVFVVLWLLQLQKYSALSMVVLIMGFSSARNNVAVNFKTEIVKKQNATYLTIMSYNVKVFDLYNWTHNTQTRLEIINTIVENKADIINLQEFYTSPIKPHTNHDTLMAALGYYAHLRITKVVNNDYFGIVTYSRFPIVNTGVVEFEKNANNIAIYTDVVLNNNDTVRVYNCHLQSVHLTKTDFNFLHQLKNGIPDTNYNQNINSIYGRLALAYRKRALQVEQLTQAIRECKYKVVLTGDCNDVPNSYTYTHLINSGLKDAFLAKGFGFGKTFVAPLLPLRIDYVLHSPTIHCVGFDMLPSKASDHYSMVAELEL